MTATQLQAFVTGLVQTYFANTNSTAMPNRLVIPYADVPNVRRDTYDKGISSNNQVSFSGGDENGTYYLSIENQKINGIVPGDWSDRTGVRANATKKFGKLSTTSSDAVHEQLAADLDSNNDLISSFW